MLKSFIVGMLSSILICAVVFFFFGRTDFQRFKNITISLSEEHRKAEQSINSIRTRLDGITGTASTITTTSNRITEHSTDADQRITTIGVGLKTADTTIERLEQRHKSIIKLIGTNRDLDFDFRKIIKRISE